MIKKLIQLFVITLLVFTATETSVFAQNCPIRKIENADKPSEAAGASVYIGQDCNKALDYFLKTLALHREAKNTILEAWDLTQIGDIYFELKDEQKTFDYYKQALPLFRQSKNISGEWEVLPMLGYISKRQKNYSLALKYMEEELLFFQGINDGINGDIAKINASTTLDKIAEIYLQIGNEPKAVECFDKSLSLARKVKSLWKEARTLTLIGNFYEAKGRKEEATTSYHAALAIYIEDNRKFPGAIFNGEGVVPQERNVDEMKNLREAIERLQK